MRNSAKDALDSRAALATSDPVGLQADIAAEQYARNYDELQGAGLQSSELPPNIGALASAIEIATSLAERRPRPPTVVSTPEPPRSNRQAWNEQFLRPTNSLVESSDCVRRLVWRLVSRAHCRYIAAWLDSTT